MARLKERQRAPWPIRSPDAMASARFLCLFVAVSVVLAAVEGRNLAQRSVSLRASNTSEALNDVLNANTAIWNDLVNGTGQFLTIANNGLNSFIQNPLNALNISNATNFNQSANTLYTNNAVATNLQKLQNGISEYWTLLLGG